MNGKATEEVKDTGSHKGSKKTPKLSENVIKHYAKYRNTKDKIKSFLVMGSRFDIEEKYEIIDCG